MCIVPVRLTLVWYRRRFRCPNLPAGTRQGQQVGVGATRQGTSRDSFSRPQDLAAGHMGRSNGAEGGVHKRFRQSSRPHLQAELGSHTVPCLLAISAVMACV